MPNQEPQLSCPHFTARSSTTSISGSISLILSLYQAHPHQVLPIYISHGRSKLGEEMLDFPVSSHTFSHLPLLSVLSSLSYPFLLPWTARHQHPLFSPTHHYPFTFVLFYQISSKHSSNLFSSPQCPYHPQRLPFPRCHSSSPAAEHFLTHAFREFVTLPQTHPVSWKVICLTWTSQYFFLFFPFPFPPLWPPLSTSSAHRVALSWPF